MFTRNFLFSLFAIVTFAAACSEKNSTQLQPTQQTQQTQRTSELQLQVFKSPTCGCCAQWVEHVENSNLSAVAHNTNNLNQIKDKYGISGRYRSCHTAVSDDGYVFEGHIPAKIIQKFLKQKPKDAIGLAVPGMPVGSPGMEVGNKFRSYPIFLLKKDGTVEEYERVMSQKEQYHGNSL